MKTCSIEKCDREVHLRGICAKHYHVQYKAEYYQNNKKRLLEKAAQYRQNNRKKLAQLQTQYYAGHKEEITKYRVDHKKKISKYNIEYKMKRRKNDTEFKLASGLRSRLRLAIRNGQKSGSAVRDLGCTIPELKQYLESKFEPWMTWDNWKLKPTKEHPKVWHIDHIKALSLFDLGNREQFLEACDYTNLQPLEAAQNIRKGNRVMLSREAT